MYLKFILLFSCISIIKCHDLTVGSVCIENSGNLTGTCKLITTCQYAMDLIKNDIKPTTCFYQGRDRYVCCPSKSNSPRRGIFGKFFGGLEEGVKRSNKVVCRYNGEEIIVCCPIFKSILNRNPSNCRLGDPPAKYNNPSDPTTNRNLRIAWRRCAEYQCNANNINPQKNVCHIEPFSNDAFRTSGGEEAKRNEFPHMAVLGVQDTDLTSNNDILWIGGGTLISTKFILTAGHVLFEQKHGAIRYALLGTNNKTDVRSGIIYTIINITPHRLYKLDSKANDIALVELDRDVQFSEFIRPACIPMPSTSTSLAEFIIAGWGEISSGGPTSRLLLKANIFEANSIECQRSIRVRGFEWDSNNMICAKGRIHKPNNQFTDSCRGDSGGPVMTVSEDIECSYVVNGITSFGPTCGAGFAAIYTKVDAYINWIVDNVWPKK